VKRCSKCKERESLTYHRYCRECRNTYMRMHRPKHRDLSYSEMRKANCRSIANVYQKRGKLVPKPCEKCGSTSRIEKHHDDYQKPLEVRWLCRAHHAEHTKSVKSS